MANMQLPNGDGRLKVVRPMATPDRLRELFTYDPSTGDLIRKIDVNTNSLAGSIAGCVARRGYRRVRVDGAVYLVHRVVWAMVFGSWPENMLDHIDGNPLNNRLENLREANSSQNQMNRDKSSTNTSGYRGVSYSKIERKFRAKITVGKKTKYLGYFRSAEEASNAFEKAAREHFGEFHVCE